MKNHKTIKRIEKALIPPKEFKVKSIELDQGIYTDPETGEKLTPEQVENLKADYDLFIICDWDGPEDEEEEEHNLKGDK